MHKEAFWNWPMSRFPIHNGPQFPDVRLCGFDVCAGLPVFIVPNSRCADWQVISRGTASLEFCVRRKANTHTSIPRFVTNSKPCGICGGGCSCCVEVFDFGMALTRPRAKARSAPSARGYKHFSTAPFARLRLSTVGTHSGNYNTRRERNNRLSCRDAPLFNVEVAERATA